MLEREREREREPRVGWKGEDGPMYLRPSYLRLRAEDSEARIEGLLSRVLMRLLEWRRSRLLLENCRLCRF